MVHDHLFSPKLTTANGLPWLLLSKLLFFAGLIIELIDCDSLFFGKWELNGGEVGEDQEVDPLIDADIDPTEGNPPEKKGWNSILKRKPTNVNQAKPSKARK